MATCIFSRNVQEYLCKPQSSFKQVLYKWLHEKKEQEIIPLLDPTAEDVKAILAKTTAIENFCVEYSVVTDGILYLNIALGGIKANTIISSTRADVCQDILTCYRQYWMDTRGLDPAPFIPILTPRSLQLAVPVSIQGYRTLAKIQVAQLSVKKQVLQEQEQAETHKALVLMKFYHS